MSARTRVVLDPDGALRPETVQRVLEILSDHTNPGVQPLTLITNTSWEVPPAMRMFAAWAGAPALAVTVTDVEEARIYLRRELRGYPVAEPCQIFLLAHEIAHAYGPVEDAHNLPWLTRFSRYLRAILPEFPEAMTGCGWHDHDFEREAVLNATVSGPVASVEAA